MKFRRRKYITNAGLQMKVTLVFVLISLLGSMASTFTFNFFAMRKFESLMWSTHIAVKDTGEIIRPLFMYVNLANILFVLGMLIIAIVWMMKIKSGPIYRMNKDLKKLAEGDLSTNIKLRKQDEFQDVAAELNDVRTHMRKRFGVIVDTYADVSKSLSKLKGGTGEAEGVYGSVMKNITEVEDELGKFEV